MVTVASVSSSADTVVFPIDIRVQDAVCINIAVVIEARSLVFPGSNVSTCVKAGKATREINTNLIIKTRGHIPTLVDISTTLGSLGRPCIIVIGLVVSVSEEAGWT